MSVFREDEYKKGVLKLSAFIAGHIFLIQFLLFSEVLPVLYYVINRSLSLSKALVNQVAATVYNRYTKNMPSGETLCGVFTRDYRHDALNCQVGYTNSCICYQII